MSQISSNTKSLVGLEETAGSVWGLVDPKWLTDNNSKAYVTLNIPLPQTLGQWDWRHHEQNVNIRRQLLFLMFKGNSEINVFRYDAVSMQMCFLSLSFGQKERQNKYV